MRGTWVAGLIAAAAGVVGCQADKHSTTVPLVEEFVDPPQEARFNNPPEQMWKKPPAKKEFKPGPGGPGGPGGAGGVPGGPGFGGGSMGSGGRSY